MDVSVTFNTIVERSEDTFAVLVMLLCTGIVCTAHQYGLHPKPNPIAHASTHPPHTECFL